MTLSLHHLVTPWDRTLPKPSALLSNNAAEAYSRRSSSLLQHHVVSNHMYDPHEGHFEENGNGITPASIPVKYTPGNTVGASDGHLTPSYLAVRNDLRRNRTSSVMSAEDTSRSSSPTSTSPLEGSHQLCVCQKEPHIPRPRNAFILYRQHHHAAIVAQHPGLPNPEISKIIGEQWKQLPDQEKEEWRVLAENEKVRHSQQYPGYRYKPRRHGRSGAQQSVSGPSSTHNDTIGTCQKCGGKLMNAPLTPYPPKTPGTSDMPQLATRIPTAQPMVSPPLSAHLRQYPPDIYARNLHSSHDPRFQYAQVQQRPAPTTLEGPELKKRRLNGEHVYAVTRPVYGEKSYQNSPGERTIPDAMITGQFHRSNMGPPARTGYPVQMQPSRPQLSQLSQQHRRDPSLTLPPLKTPLSQHVQTSLSAGPQSQRSGIEAMIMSIPVLNKVKILSQISPFLAAPGPASPPREIRGAIIAVEGMDPASVSNMAQTLSEQLERDSKFAVRIFKGPDPYQVLAASNRASNGEGEHLGFSSFLDLISQWHKISKEMQEYITKKPRSGGESPEDVEMQDRLELTSPQFSPMNEGSKTPRPKTPISAVSPKTIIQTADLSLKSPSVNTNTSSHHSPNRGTTSQTPQPKPRIPASAIAQAQAQGQAPTETEPDQRQSRIPQSFSNPSKQTNPSQQQKQQQRTEPQTTTTNTTNLASSHTIPIAIVPHYQLTTVDTSSIAMPITDAYSPHSHWQWLATLWRGCIGPDVTVIIQASEISEDNDRETTSSSSAGAAAAAGGTRIGFSSGQATINGLGLGLGMVGQRASISGPPGGGGGGGGGIQSQSQNQIQSQGQSQQDVEIRLMDCRAVVVRAPSGYGNNNSNTGIGGGGSSGNGNGSSSNEWWEKAKRRVGFEVEEFLRR